MYVERLPMVVAEGIPSISRVGLLASSAQSQMYSDPHATTPMFHHPSKILLGSGLMYYPQNLMKTIHVSLDNEYVFETVIALEAHESWYLYVKQIGKRNDLAISLASVNQFSGGEQLDSISKLLWEETLGSSPLRRPSDVDCVLPPLFFPDHSDMESVWDMIWSHVPVDSTMSRYGNMFNREPGLFEALMSGNPAAPPHLGFVQPLPFLRLSVDPIPRLHDAYVTSRAGGDHLIINCPRFDDVVLSAINHRFTRFSLTTSLHMAATGRLATATIHTLEDPYSAVLKISEEDNTHTSRAMYYLFKNAVQTYCSFYKMDISTFFEYAGSDSGSITIAKTTNEEVIISISDKIHNVTVCFYSWFPMIALCTKSAGRVVSMR